MLQEEELIKSNPIPIKYVNYLGHRFPELTDESTIKSRQKQIDHGKNTIGYNNYIRTLSYNNRHPNDPITPPSNMGCSTRSFHGFCSQWRIRLHRYDHIYNDYEIAYPLIR